MFPPLSGIMTVSFPPTIAGPTEFDVQLVAARFAVYSSVKPPTSAGQVNPQLPPCRDMLSLGRFTPIPETDILPVPLVAAEISPVAHGEARPSCRHKVLARNRFEEAIGATRS